MIFACAIAIAIVVYTYFGYPIIIGILARVFPRRPSATDEGWTPTVSALIPIYNAASDLSAKLDSLLALAWPADKLQILIYSDGATDASESIVESYAARDPRVQLVRGGARAGKPTAVNRMLAVATGEVLLMTDVRQPLDVGCLRALVQGLTSTEVACVSGNLVLPTNVGAGVYWRYEKWLRSKEARFRSMLGVSGAIYAIRKIDLPGLPDDTILDDMWIPLRLRLQGRVLSFAEDAIAHDQAFDDDREFGRKVRTIAGQYQLLGQLPSLLWPWSNPSWFEFVSHKLMRLVCPWALLALFVLLPLGWLSYSGRTFGAGQPFGMMFGATALAQLAFYALALLGDRGGKPGQIARTFVVMNAAAVVGLWRQVRGSQRITW